MVLSGVMTGAWSPAAMTKTVAPSGLNAGGRQTGAVTGTHYANYSMSLRSPGRECRVISNTAKVVSGERLES